MNTTKERHSEIVAQLAALKLSDKPKAQKKKEGAKLRRERRKLEAMLGDDSTGSLTPITGQNKEKKKKRKKIKIKKTVELSELEWNQYTTDLILSLEKDLGLQSRRKLGVGTPGYCFSLLAASKLEEITPQTFLDKFFELMGQEARWFTTIKQGGDLLLALGPVPDRRLS